MVFNTMQPASAGGGVITNVPIGVVEASTYATIVSSELYDIRGTAYISYDVIDIYLRQGKRIIDLYYYEPLWDTYINGMLVVVPGKYGHPVDIRAYDFTSYTGTSALVGEFSGFSPNPLDGTKAIYIFGTLADGTALEP